ncbi:aldehyde dehydrogenase family protein [Cellulomonas sp. KRMCY2]|uniref:aldehyde dehydrogenase family protein n=1 Tax=Cellulomonas sp. KRMCY2 TaxID=1304865 RepID=UPI00045EBB6C|nr:aldehyde dehydrogenase family protein [Cellulomonas sp. KRMCY2]
MEELDDDLRSVQEARRLAVTCRTAQREFATATQQEVDRVCAAMADAVYREAARLGAMAVEETGYGVPAHKRIKVEFASRAVWESIKDVPTVGILRRDPAAGIVEIGAPVGVVVGLCPSTNPSSTAVYKVLISVKARNGCIIAPHPAAKRSTYEAVKVMIEAGERAGMPKGLVACMQQVSLQGSQELMKHYATSVILATGGTPMVRAAHSSGKPAFGVGPGNVPVYVDRSADVLAAAEAIVNSKAFDCSTICATEQSVVADEPIAGTLRAEMERLGAYWVNPAQKAALERTVFAPGGAMNPRAVGKTPQALAQLAGIEVPAWARILVAELSAVGREEPLSAEKLTTVLGWYVEKGWRAGCDRSIELLRFGGDGHSLVIHATDTTVIETFGLEKPAFRILVNTWGTLGAIGATTGLVPAMTLAPGGIGGAVVSDNITVTHLLNIKRLAYALHEPPAAAFDHAPDVRGAPRRDGTGRIADRGAPAPAQPQDRVERIVRRVLEELGGGP